MENFLVILLVFSPFVVLSLMMLMSSKPA